MPIVPSEVLDCAIYLYRTKSDANQGECAGGSGFLVGIPWKANPGKHHIYAVTASHVVKEGSCLVIRLNAADGISDVVSTGADAWFHHPISDVAICPIDLCGKYKYRFILDGFLLQEAEMTPYWAAAGQDVFVVGRFLAHDGKQKNTPALRFGNISMMPIEPIPHTSPDRLQQESFLVEFRSIGGCSGSPVFLWPNVWSLPRDQRTIEQVTLLGVDWCHISTFEKVKEQDETTDVAGGWKVRSNTGVAGIIPAWKVSELLGSEEMVAQRMDVEKRKPDGARH